MNKRSKNQRYDDPTAFKLQFPAIRKQESAATLLSKLETETAYKMGKITASVALTRGGYFMSIHGKDRYPTWDEIVWLRYNLLPDSAVMALILPNLDAYINVDGQAQEFVFTMEQKAWSILPLPTCPTCGNNMIVKHDEYASAKAICKACDQQQTIDLATWNEEHGHGFNGKKVEV